jgi:NAD(P)-dependent dehydrogenase (short-subunit alcohol dehydrogenase family)
MIETPMLLASANAEERTNNPAVFKRSGKPAEVAALIAYLLGDESQFTTGAAYSIDGGWFC